MSNKPKCWAGKRPSEDQLNQILDDHAEWLKSGRQGSPPHHLGGIDISDMDLRGCDLRYVDFSPGHVLVGARKKPIRSNLESASLECAKLNHANLTDAKLQYAKLGGADLIDADLTEADLRSANLQKFRFTAGSPVGLPLEQETNLTNATLNSVRLNSAHLKDVNLQGLDMVGASFGNGDPERPGADLQACNLAETDLSYADLP